MGEDADILPSPAAEYAYYLFDRLSFVAGSGTDEHLDAQVQRIGFAGLRRHARRVILDHTERYESAIVETNQSGPFVGGSFCHCRGTVDRRRSPIVIRDLSRVIRFRQYANNLERLPHEVGIVYRGSSGIMAYDYPVVGPDSVSEPVPYDGGIDVTCHVFLIPKAPFVYLEAHCPEVVGSNSCIAE